jgi:hypothetical protein
VSEDHITFDARGLYERRQISWRGCPDDRSARRSTLERGGSYDVVGDSITLSFGGGTEVEIELAGRLRGDTIVTFGDQQARAFRYVRRPR